ncbi:MAG: CDP-alcohol phosphatidyltransferase family protein [Nitrososphaerota archaeon]|nr:CDP-alcohol phosphatidyltransferase family protein [Nitrososphaerota archaeon]MDG7026075.1 CDP-alcohol phosphatidyltransferase family protein [Nitrososphaerota archaeon]
MLDRLRGRLESSLRSVGTVFARVEGSPTAWTTVGLVLSVLAAASYSTGRYPGELLGGVLILVGGWFDVVDGAVARVTGRVSKRGAFLDSTMDRVAEVALFTGILLGKFADPATVLLALSLSLLVSYTRAKGDALGVRLAGVGIGERSERLLIVAVSSLAGLLGWGLLLVIGVAGFTFVERTYTAAKGLGAERSDAAATPP